MWPTPLERLDRFGDAVGAEVWAKRDDMGSVGLAGNKVRKFELVLGRALADGCETLVTTGAEQSNSARAGAAAAARLGLGCVLVLSGDAPARPTANLLLDRLFGADVRFAGDVSWSELDRRVDATVAELAEAGRRAVAAPVGCSSPLGALGFALAWLELDAQMAAAGLAGTAADSGATVVHASSSGGTHAGMLVGRVLAGGGPDVVAVDVGGLHGGDEARHIAHLARDAASLVGLDAPIDATAVTVDHAQMGPAYGSVTEAAVEAIDLLARTEGIVADPVYSGKGLAAVVAMARSGVSGPLVFWHTGGWHAVFEPRYGDAVLGALAPEVAR
jgi:1-aminocyclopropane-1-carboxylate deaminase/D-cysteine desulfhydrase-like pyridoxal-dependent ACC family enzyme